MKPARTLLQIMTMLCEVQPITIIYRKFICQSWFRIRCRFFSSETEENPEMRILHSCSGGAEHHKQFYKKKKLQSWQKSIVQPSEDVIRVCRFAETELHILENKDTLQEKYLLFILIINILNNVWNCIFKVRNQHALDFDVEGNHVINLIKTISYNYCKVRLRHEAKSLHNTDCRVRRKLTKSILFKNQ